MKWEVFHHGIFDPPFTFRILSYSFPAVRCFKKTSEYIGKSLQVSIESRTESFFYSGIQVLSES